MHMEYQTDSHAFLYFWTGFEKYPASSLHKETIPKFRMFFTSISTGTGIHCSGQLNKTNMKIYLLVTVSFLPNLLYVSYRSANKLGGSQAKKVWNKHTLTGVDITKTTTACKTAKSDEKLSIIPKNNFRRLNTQVEMYLCNNEQ